MKAGWRCLHKKLQVVIWVLTKLQASLYQVLQKKVLALPIFIFLFVALQSCTHGS
jgi:hypothetical protein